MASKGTRGTVLNDPELEPVFAAGQSVRSVLQRVVPEAYGRTTGRTVGPTTSFQNVSECEATQIPTDPHRSPQIPADPDRSLQIPAIISHGIRSPPLSRILIVLGFISMA